MAHGVLCRHSHARLWLQQQVYQVLQIVIVVDAGEGLLPGVVAGNLPGDVLHWAALIVEALVKGRPRVEHHEEADAHGVHVRALGVVRPDAGRVRFRRPVRHVVGAHRLAHYVSSRLVGGDEGGGREAAQHRLLLLPLPLLGAVDPPDQQAGQLDVAVSDG